MCVPKKFSSMLTEVKLAFWIRRKLGTKNDMSFSAKLNKILYSIVSSFPLVLAVTCGLVKII
jgi:hypothetical protein